MAREDEDSGRPSGSGPAHAGRERVLPEIVAGEGGLGESRPRAVRDHDVLREGGPAHVGVAQGLGHEALVGLHRLEAVPRVAARADDELGEVAAVRHHEHVRPQAHQEVQRRQARHMPPERRQLLRARQLLLRHLQMHGNGLLVSA